MLNGIGRRTLGSRILSGPGRGLRFKGGDTIGYILGISEPLVQRALVVHLQQGGVLYDVGSHAGFEALLGRRLVGANGQVHCFEPVPANVLTLQSNVDANNFDNVIVHAVALSDSDGTARIDVTQHGITARLADDGHLEVRTVRLDSLALRAPTVVKVDVEGAEAAVLRGMKETLRTHRPTVIVEIHGAEEGAVRRELADAGYACVERLDDGGMPHLLAHA